MAAKPITAEAIALTEKKMGMALDDIIKMSKKPTIPNVRKQRVSNKIQKPMNGASGNGNSSKVRRFMDSRSSVRQGVLAQRRSNYQGNQFPLATEVARKAVIAPIRNRPLNRNRTVNWNKPRIGAPPVQRRTEVGFAVKRHLSKVVPNKRPQTMDSLFANLKEERMRTQTQQNGVVRAQHNTRHVGGVQQRQWGRGRFGNFAN